MERNYIQIEFMEPILSAHTWLSKEQAWKLIIIKFILIRSEHRIHNLNHLDLIMQEWAEHLAEMNDHDLKKFCNWIDEYLTSDDIPPDTPTVET